MTRKLYIIHRRYTCNLCHRWWHSKPFGIALSGLQRITTTFIFCSMKTTFINVHWGSDERLWFLFKSTQSHFGPHVAPRGPPTDIASGNAWDKLRLRCDLALSNSNPQATWQLSCYHRNTATGVEAKWQILLIVWANIWRLSCGLEQWIQSRISRRYWECLTYYFKFQLLGKKNL